MADEVANVPETTDEFIATENDHTVTINPVVLQQLILNQFSQFTTMEYPPNFEQTTVPQCNNQDDKECYETTKTSQPEETHPPSTTGQPQEGGELSTFFFIGDNVPITDTNLNQQQPHLNISEEQQTRLDHLEYYNLPSYTMTPLSEMVKEMSTSANDFVTFNVYDEVKETTTKPFSYENPSTDSPNTTNIPELVTYVNVIHSGDQSASSTHQPINYESSTLLQPITDKPSEMKQPISDESLTIRQPFTDKPSPAPELSSTTVKEIVKHTNLLGNAGLDYYYYDYPGVVQFSNVLPPSQMATDAFKESMDFDKKEPTYDYYYHQPVYLDEETQVRIDKLINVIIIQSVSLLYSNPLLVSSVVSV